jgi:hypothetical protein
MEAEEDLMLNEIEYELIDITNTPGWILDSYGLPLRQLPIVIYGDIKKHRTIKAWPKGTEHLRFVQEYISQGCGGCKK